MGIQEHLQSIKYLNGKYNIISEPLEGQGEKYTNIKWCNTIG